MLVKEKEGKRERIYNVTRNLSPRHFYEDTLKGSLSSLVNYQNKTSQLVFETNIQKQCHF